MLIATNKYIHNTKEPFRKHYWGAFEGAPDFAIRLRVAPRFCHLKIKS